MAIIYLALGSNVGNSEAYINTAVMLLANNITAITRAPLYTSKAMGYTEQADFVNTAIMGHTSMTPNQLLVYVKQIEQEVGRVRRFRWGPREIDIDIIFYDDVAINTPNLKIPHAAFSQRDFVLQPLCDLSPDLVDPVSKQTVLQLLTALPENNISIAKYVSRNQN